MLFALFLSVSAPAAATDSQRHSQMSVLSTHFASSPRTCAVLQAAYATASRRKAPIYPPDVRMHPRVLELHRFVPEARARQALSPEAFDDLVAQASRYDFPNFKPACRWKGKPGPAVDDDGHATFVTFTSPIFASSGRLAIVEVSFREEHWPGYGLTCVVRQGGGRWKARCWNSWIS